MYEMKNIPSLEGKKRIVIVGGGFGGLKLATKLNPRYFQVLLLDKNNYHQFQPLLYQVAIAGLEATSTAYPFRKNFQRKRHIHFRMCEVSKVIPGRNLIETSCGSLEYDCLVIAAGCDTNFFGNDSLKAGTITLKSVSEALYARNCILQSFEQATITSDREEVEKLLTFAVVGGGATGVELAGALADMKNFVLPKDYPELDLSRMTIHLIDGSLRLLSAMSEKASGNASRTLQRRGVIIHQPVFVSSYENDCIRMSDGSDLYTKNVIWVAGIKANSIEGFDSSVYGRGGRFIVDGYCRVRGYENIFAIGDIACMETPEYPNGHPQVAQGAIQMGELLAKNLERSIRNEDLHTFKYKDKGALATIGRNAAVADLHKLRFGGRLAWWLWLLVHIATMIGVKNKLLILINWAWSYVTYDLSLRLLIRPKKCALTPPA